MSQSKDQEYVREIINKKRAKKDQKNLQNVEFVWNCFNSDHYRLLSQLLANGRKFNPEDHNILVEANPNDSPLSYTYYLRCAVYTVTELDSALRYTVIVLLSFSFKRLI